MILDVGCGNNPRGDVNLDLFIEATEHRALNQKVKAVPLDPKKIKNFIMADSQYLPFKDNAFEKVISCEVIEHTEKPALMLKEIVRVSSNEILIECPHWLATNKRYKPKHINHFRCRWFNIALKSLGLNLISIEVNLFSYFPSYYMPLIRIPKGIRVNAFKSYTRLIQQKV